MFKLATASLVIVSTPVKWRQPDGCSPLPMQTLNRVPSVWQRLVFLQWYGGTDYSGFHCWSAQGTNILLMGLAAYLIIFHLAATNPKKMSSSNGLILWQTRWFLKKLQPSGGSYSHWYSLWSKHSCKCNLVGFPKTLSPNFQHIMRAVINTIENIAIHLKHIKPLRCAGQAFIKMFWMLNTTKSIQ